MFIKSFKTKSNTQIKSTERKKLRNKIATAFKISEDDLNKLLPNKGALTQVKIITNNEQPVTVYSCDKRPLFFELAGNDDSPLSASSVLLPTVYALWILPNLIPIFTTHQQVFPRLLSGADLMLPGVIRQGEGYTTYGSYNKDAVVGVNLTSNRSAIGVGLLAKSSHDLYFAKNSGICVKMLHVFGDKLWGIEASACQQVPNTGAVVKPPTIDDFPALGETGKPKKAESTIATKEANVPLKEAEAKEPEEEESESTSGDEDDEQSDDGQTETLENDIKQLQIDDTADNSTEPQPGISQDDKLKKAFLLAIKKMGKNPPVPLLTSNFYRNHILTVDNSIEIKHTSYKKLSKFLQEMSKENYLVIKEETKGVEKIISFNTSHPDIVNLTLNISDTTSSSSNAGNLFETEMKELFIITNECIKFFNQFDLKCGEGVEPVQVKKYVKEYVCNKKLQDPANIRLIHTDELIREICDLDVSVKTIQFDDLLADITQKMKHSFAMRNKNELKTGGKQSTIKMSLATRAGNKKVTLVDHLEMFGIRLPEFAQACKIGVAASTSIIRPDCASNAKKGQLLVQGNQIRFLYKLLTETYKIPPKYIAGLDLAKKEKKPKKK